MYRFYIDTSDIERKVKNFNKVEEINVLKEVNWYLNQVYADLAKKHGSKYTYMTPPVRERTNLRVRRRNLLRWLKESRFTRKEGDKYVAGFDIPSENPNGNYLGIHVGMDGSEDKFELTPSNAKYTYTFKGQKKILVPLRAGLNSDGTPKPATDRMGLKAIPFKVAKDIKSFDWSGEKKSNLERLHTWAIILYKQSGRKKIPMYVLINQARIPRRMLLVPAIEKYQELFYERLEKQVDRELNRVTKK